MRRRSEDMSLGQDSFLVIVANLVGILIILIVIVGAQAGTAWVQREPNEDLVTETETIKTDIKVRTAEAKNLKIENYELQHKIRQQEALVSGLRANRRTLLLAMEAAKTNLADAQLEMQNERLIRNDLFGKITALKQEVLQVQYEFTAVSNQSKTVVQTIPHYPTPIARTVFSDEVHFQILGDRIVHVPLPELLELMKGEWKDEARKLQHAENTWGAVGPIENFQLNYLLTSFDDLSQESRFGVRFAGFELQCVRQNVGEPIEVALAPGSSFGKQLARLIPAKTTVSLWVYPDGFDHLMKVREWLRSEGFQSASWPLDHGKPISGGPSGLRTTTS